MPKYFMPTMLLSGQNCVKRHFRHLIHGRKCMIVTGRNSAVVSGALADVTDVLNEHGVEYEIYNKITGTTGISEIYALSKTMKEHGIEYIIGIGGGSTLDAAKAAAVYATNDIEPMEIYDEVYENKPLKVVCIPTTAGTGSDTTHYVMLTLDDIKNRRSFCSVDCFPYATFLDYRYTMTLPLEVTRNTAIDALCHAVESYLSVNASSFSDLAALEAIRRIGSCTAELVTGRISQTDRANLLVAASFGGMAVAHTGLNVVHAMGHQVTCGKGIPHGRANGALLVEFIAWMAKHEIIRAVEVMDAFGKDLSNMKRFMNRVIPTTEQITEDDIKQWLDKSIVDGIRDNCPAEFTKEDERKLYYNAFIDNKRKYTQWAY